MEKTDRSEQHQGILYKGVFLLCGVITPIISITWDNHHVSEFSFVDIGWILSISFLTCFALSIFSQTFQKIMHNIIYSIFIIATFSTLYLSYLNHFDLDYTILLVIVIFTVSIILNKPLLLSVYYIFSLSLFLLLLYYSSDTIIKKDTLIVMFLLFFAVSNLNAWVKYVERKSLKTSEEQFRLVVGQMQEGLAVHEIILDENGDPVDYRFISVNRSFEKLTGLLRKDIINKTVLEVMPNTEKYWIETYGKVAITGTPDYYENYSAELDKYYSVSVFSPQKNQFAVIITDITENKKSHEEIEYLSFHDQLTGLYNRRFYELTMKRLDHSNYLPLALIMIDVNGLKLTNDAFGHTAGDILLERLAKIIYGVCRKDDVAARIGGDEFVLLLPNTDLERATKIIQEINELTVMEDIEHIILSVSAGCSVRTSVSEDLIGVFKKAEDDMYRNKLSESLSMRSKTIDLIMNTLYEKNTREMLHSKRVSKICEALATKMNFSKDAVNQIKTAGLMHDIGKIVIYEDILNKTQKLNETELDEIERHSEIGYRILSSVNEFSEIADYVLEHHEKWDGHGYPRGIAGEEISLQARIISIADAYDAMTTDRTYRKALSKEDAVEEIRKYSGTQFDPDLTEIFAEMVLEDGME